MTVHLCEGPDLSQVHILPVSQGNNLVKGKDEVKGIVQYILFIQSLTVLWDLGEEGREGGCGSGQGKTENKEEENKTRRRVHHTHILRYIPVNRIGYIGIR